MTNQTIEEIKRQAELAAAWLDSLQHQEQTAVYVTKEATLYYEAAPALIAANELLQQQQDIIRSLEAKVEGLEEVLAAIPKTNNYSSPWDFIYDFKAWEAALQHNEETK